MIMTMNKKNLSLDNENGFASITLALILIIVLALITVGFSQLARREQQSAVDKQLANQAYYAAETGINDVILGIQGNPKASPAIAPTITNSTAGVNQGQCLTLPNTTVSTDNGVTYNCAVVNLQLPNIQYDNVASFSDRYITFTTLGNATVGSLTVQWGSADGHSQFPSAVTSSSFPTYSSWNGDNYPAVLEFTVTPINNDYARTSLINTTYTAYLYPASSGTSNVNYTPNSQPNNTDGSIVPGDCSNANGAYACQATISNINTPGPYLIHIINYYDASNININGTDVNGNPLTITDGQAEIDVTGSDKDVSKRVDVRIPIVPSPVLPDFSLEGVNLCKQFNTFPNSSTPNDPSDPACALN